MAKKNIKDLNLKGKKVLMRVDFNVPMKVALLLMIIELFKLYQQFDMH